MATKEQKLNIADITFDDFIGDGLNTLDEQETKPKDELENEEESEEESNDSESESESSGRKPSSDEDDDDDEELQSKKYAKEDEEDDDESDEEDSEESGSVAESIAKALGYDIENDYADTEEGLVEFTKDIAQNIAEDQLNELFQQFPLVQKHLDFVLAGGDSEKFFQAYNPNLDYSQYEIDQNDSRTQKAFVSEYFKSKGHDEEFIKDMLEDYEDSGKLYDKAVVAQKQLATIQSKEREQIVEQQKREKQEQEKAQEEFWENVASTIDQGKEFAGIRIPEKEKAKFFDYISAPVDKSGRTRRDMDYSNSELDVKLAIDYLMYKGMNLQDIITTKAKTESVKSLRDKIQRNEERVKNYGKVEKNRAKKFDPDQLDMKKLFE
jgi:hypothetical protein